MDATPAGSQASPGAAVDKSTPRDRRTHVRRANVTACTRCRARKQRCDQNLPACSKCLKAGVPCISTDSDGNVAPRSYIKNLEDRVAYLEMQLLSHGVTDVDMLSPRVVAEQQSSSSNPPRPSSPKDDPVGRIATASLQPDSTSNDSLSGLSFLLSLLAGPMAQLFSSEKRQSHHHAVLDALPYEMHIELPPKHAAKQLLDTYFKHCDFFSPIISSREEFEAMIEPLYDESHPAEDALSHIKFQAFAVFGTSILLMNRTDRTVPVTKSEAYFRAAVKVLSENPWLIWMGDLDNLANLLLIIQYACFAANLPAAWHFLGLATRLAIQLGLHKEHPPSTVPNLTDVERSRWLFWSLYTFERTLCFVIGYPASLPDEAIDAPYPSVIEGDSQHPLAVHLLKCRRLQSEIYARTSQPGSFSGMSDEAKAAWRSGMQARLLTWRQSTPGLESTSQLAPAEIFHASYFNALVLLFYPSRHFPNPSAQELSVLAHAATESVNSYRRAFRAGELRFYWRTIHNLFRSGVALVYCSRVTAMQMWLNDNQVEMLNSINLCSSILWGMAERYPAGQGYVDIFENLIRTTLPGNDENFLDVAGGMTGPSWNQPQVQDVDHVFPAVGEAEVYPTVNDLLQFGFG